jgi:cathepsin B
MKVGYPFGCDLSEAHLYFWAGGDRSWGSYPENDTNFLVEYGVPDEACWPYPDPDAPQVMLPKNTTAPNWQERTVKITNWSYLPKGVDSIKHALVNNGPVPTYLDVYEDFQRYSGGVYQHRWGKSVGIHIVCIMGYSKTKNTWRRRKDLGRIWMV